MTILTHPLLPIHLTKNLTTDAPSTRFTHAVPTTGRFVSRLFQDLQRLIGGAAGTEPALASRRGKQASLKDDWDFIRAWESLRDLDSMRNFGTVGG